MLHLLEVTSQIPRRLDLQFPQYRTAPRRRPARDGPGDGPGDAAPAEVWLHGAVLPKPQRTRGTARQEKTRGVGRLGVGVRRESGGEWGVGGFESVEIC